MDDEGLLQAMFSEIDNEAQRIEQSAARQRKKKKTLTDMAIFGSTAQLKTGKPFASAPAAKTNPFLKVTIPGIFNGVITRSP